MNHACERCLINEAEAAQCPGDGGFHHHGFVHIKGGGIQAVCRDCLIDVALEWGQTHVERVKTLLASN